MFHIKLYKIVIISKRKTLQNSTVTEHGVTEQWSYTDSDPDFCTLSGLAAHYFSLLQQAWRLLWVDHRS
jgi:hypothetical protein